MAEGPNSDIAALVVAVQASAPPALRALKQWLLWRFELYEGDVKPRKVPYWVSGRKRKGTQGGNDDRTELATLDIALTHLVHGRWDGVGFAFLPGDGLIGIDIDGAIDPESGEVSERCQNIVLAAASYTEYSPSGKGVHIIVQGNTRTNKDNSIGLEVFCGSQYFTFTGRRWSGTPDQVVPIADEVVRRLHKTIDEAKAATKRTKKAASAPPAAPVKAAPAPAGDDGPTDFQRVNALAMASLDAWVPQLFPDAAYHGGTGAWRVSSKALGRTLQEDLSLHPDGISDFGAERASIYGTKGMTPIDVVMEFGHKDAKAALHWLADRLGMPLSRGVKRGQRKAPARSAAEPEPAADAGSTPSPASGEAGGDDEPPPPDDTGGDAAPPPASAPSWRDCLLFARGVLQDCRENVFYMLTLNPKLQHLVAFDLFAHRITKVGKPPWDSEPGEWTTNDDYELGLYLAARHGLVIKGEGVLAAGVAMAAHRARFHPVKDWLTGLKWDETPRLAFWMHECLGAADKTYHNMVGTFFLQGLVARILDPGCQMDHMIVLEGGQGHGKSSALRALAGAWFADTPIRIGDKDALLNLAGVLIYEVAELDSFNKAEVTAVKQYVSGRVDRVREPYTRRPVDRPRSCVLAGTTNQHEYFKDPTGSRRFWPVAIPGAIDLAKLGEWRDQLFAEAVHRYRAGERHYPTREEEKTYFWPEQDQREIADPWFERVALWLEAGEQELKSTFLGSEILSGALHVPSDRIDGARNMATRVGVIMHKLGWGKARDATGARLWRYVRPKPAPATTGLRSSSPTQHACGVPTPAWSADDFTGEGTPDA